MNLIRIGSEVINLDNVTRIAYGYSDFGSRTGLQVTVHFVAGPASVFHEGDGAAELLDWLLDDDNMMLAVRGEGAGPPPRRWAAGGGGWPRLAGRRWHAIRSGRLAPALSPRPDLIGRLGQRREERLVIDATSVLHGDLAGRRADRRRRLPGLRPRPPALARA